MEGLTFVHCGDIHLDARFTATGLTGQKAVQRRQELRDVFKRIIDEVIKQNAQVLLICGDLFEHEYVSRKTVEFVIDQLNRIPNVHIFITPGNHDPWVSNSYYATLKWPAHVHIFQNITEGIELPEHNAVIYGVGFAGHYQYESMVDNIHHMDVSKINILMTHGTLDGSSGNCPYHPISGNKISSMGFDYIALGHIHKKQIYKNNIIYCGSPESLGFDEPGEHGVFIGKVSKERLQTEFVPLAKRQCKTIEINTSNIKTIDEIEEMMKCALQGYEKYLVKLIFKGKIEAGIDLDLPLLTSRWSQNCFYLKLIDSTENAYQLEELCEQYNLRGVYAKKMLEAINIEEDQTKKKKLYRALYLGLDALSGNEVNLD